MESGIIENDISGLIDIICHTVIAEYAMNSLIDNQVISIPDHSDVLTTICAQLKRDNVSLQVVTDAINVADTNCWFVTDNDKYIGVHSYIEKIWNNA